MKTEGKRALLVGINRYDHQKITNLNFCVNDVTSTFKILTDPLRGGFTQDNCFLMTDKSRKKREKPTRSNLMSSVKMLSKMADPDDYILFFFSGHGIYDEVTGRSYLLPVDASLNVLADTAVPIDWIKATMGKSKARAKVMVLDACHSGAIKGKAESGLMTKGLHDDIFPAPEGFAILSSCKMFEASYEMSKTKHSVFTHFLNEGLGGAADFDSDGKIAAPDASRYAVNKTLEWARKNHVEQSLNLDYKCVRDLILVYVPKVGEIAEKVEVVQGSVPAVLEKMKMIVGFWGEKDWEAKRWARKLCAFLLRYHNQELIKVRGKKYFFPGGSLDLTLKEPKLEFTYSRAKREAVDRFMLAYSSSKGRIVNVEYLMPKNVTFDTKKIVELEDKSKLFDVIYLPETQLLVGYLQEPFLKSKEIPFQIAFRNPTKDSELASIKLSRFSRPFEKDSYKKIKPDELLKFLGDIFTKL